MKYIWYREEKWEFVRWLSRVKEDQWILVKRETECVTESGKDCYEWQTIDCGNEEWLWSNKENDKLFKALARSEKSTDKINEKIKNKWVG